MAYWPVPFLFEIPSDRLTQIFFCATGMMVSLGEFIFTIMVEEFRILWVTLAFSPTHTNRSFHVCNIRMRVSICQKARYSLGISQQNSTI